VTRLSARELNRATLQRQWLLERHQCSAADAIGHLIGLQAQVARPPFIGLWSRLVGFERDELAREIRERRVVKASLMRGTLHLVTTDDYLRLRGTFQPVLSSALDAVLKERSVEVDREALVAEARPFLHAEPRSFAELTAFQAERHPGEDPGALRYTVRTHLPLVQVPIEKAWCFPGNPKFALAEDWLARRIPASGEHVGEVIKRYLAAFGPATARDMETWSYLTDLGPAFEALRAELSVHQDARGREVFDVPSGALVDADAPAPVRFLGEFDNLLLAHVDRTRFVPTEIRKAVYLPGLRVAATVLVDGVVAATWTTAREKKTARLVVTPLAKLSAYDRRAIEAEAEALVRFAEPEAASHEVQFASA
jgi:hypothetical protein